MSQYMNITIFQNDTACSRLNEAYDILIDFKNSTRNAHENSTGLGLSSGIIIFSLITLFAGARLVKPVATVMSALTSFLFVFKITENNSSGFTCDSRLIFAGFISLIVALLTASLINCAIFMIGSLALAGLTHLVFMAIPGLNEIGGLPIILGQSVLYWGSILILGVTGGCLIKRKKNLALEAMTATLGGISLAYGLHTIVEYTNTDINRAVFVGVGMGSSVVGFFVQRKLRLRKKKGKKDKKEKKTKTPEP